MPRRPLSEIEADIALGTLALDDAVTALADASGERDLAMLLGRRAGTPEADGLRILAGAAEFPVSMLCRVAGLTVNGYSAVLRMRRRKGRSDFANPSVLLTAYLRLLRLPSAELDARWKARDSLEPSGA